MFWKIQEIFYLIDTKIFQFDMLEVEKIGSKDGNPTQKKLKNGEIVISLRNWYFQHPVPEVFKFMLDNNIQILNIRWNPCKSKG